jgi:cell division transport system ATP-binding protein
MIVLRNVKKTFGNKEVLNDVSLRIDPGEFVCLFGEGSCGKTTVISLLLGETLPESGTVEVDGANLARVPKDALQLYRRRIGVMFEDGKLLPHATVYENIALPLEIWGAPESWLKSRVEELLSMLSLKGKAEAFPETLSAGERAKVCLARAIAAKPLILFCDEPTGNLDLSEAANFIRVLQQLQKDGTTIVFTTHDAALLDLLNARVVAMENGKIVADKKTGGTISPASNVKQMDKHDIFNERGAEEVPVSTPQASAPITKAKTTTPPADDSKGKRKVHITSINS